jgi:hypothetical protein
MLDLCELSQASESKRAETLADAMNQSWHGGIASMASPFFHRCVSEDGGFMGMGEFWVDV